VREQSNTKQSQKITCPKCDHQFAWGDAKISEEQRAIYELYMHGHSMRAIGRMFHLAPESIRYRIKELQRKVGVKDDGILGKMTLKAIMDKLSQ
jgi:DNA-binding NarL/FixJ family response regulator